LLSPELAIGIRRVQGVKRLGRKSGNWLTRNQAQQLVNAGSNTDLRGWRDGAILGLLLGCGLRRSEVVGLTLDQLQTTDGHWVIVDLIGKGRRLRTVPVPSWCKQLLDAWLRHSGVSRGKVFRRVSKGGRRQGAGVTANVVWYAVKRRAGQAGLANLAPHDLRRTCARLCHERLNRANPEEGVATATCRWYQKEWAVGAASRWRNSAKWSCAQMRGTPSHAPRGRPASMKSISTSTLSRKKIHSRGSKAVAAAIGVPG
jgi:integrase